MTHGSSKYKKREKRYRTRDGLVFRFFSRYLGSLLVIVRSFIVFCVSHLGYCEVRKAPWSDSSQATVKKFMTDADIIDEEFLSSQSSSVSAEKMLEEKRLEAAKRQSLTLPHHVFMEGITAILTTAANCGAIAWHIVFGYLAMLNNITTRYGAAVSQYYDEKVRKSIALDSNKVNDLIVENSIVINEALRMREQKDADRRKAEEQAAREKHKRETAEIERIKKESNQQLQQLQSKPLTGEVL